MTDAHHLAAGVEAVSRLHSSDGGHNPLCQCSIEPGAGANCEECRQAWPCKTVRAIENVLLPRRIAELSELDALQDGAVLHDGGGYGPYSVWVKDAAMGWDDVVWWRGGSDVPSSSPDIQLPALVIYEYHEEQK